MSGGPRLPRGVRGSTQLSPDDMFAQQSILSVRTGAGSRLVVAAGLIVSLVACGGGSDDAGSVEAPGRFYDVYVRDPAIAIAAEIDAMAPTQPTDMPSTGYAVYNGGFIGEIGGCGFNPGCDSGNTVYGEAQLTADFDALDITAKLNRLVIEYDELDADGLPAQTAMDASVITVTAGSISGSTFSDIDLVSTPTIFIPAKFGISGEVSGSFLGGAAEAATADFSGFIAPLSGGVASGPAETLTGTISAKQ